jgi:predicted amidohydrolase
MSETIVACCQLAPLIGEAEANRAATCTAIEDAARSGAQVVIVPELAVSGYVFSDADEARRLAEPLDGATAHAWSDLARAHDIVIAGGFAELGDDGLLYNSALLVDRDGVRAIYRKAHLWDREKLVFEPGSDPPPVIDTSHGRIGVMICYDVEFPEWVRLPALAGAELLCVPLNWPGCEWPVGERPAEVVRVQAAASSNRMFIAACDRAGVERGVSWISGSVIVDASGFPLAGPVLQDRAETIIARCDLAQAREKRISEHNDVIADRRPALYEAIARTYAAS